MKMRVENLTGVALDWAVWEAWEDGPSTPLTIYGKGLWYGGAMDKDYEWRPSTDWSQGGPIIERELIHIWPYDCGPDWKAEVGWYGETFYGEGPTPLIAAMRCFVASRLGDEVDVPEELK